MPSYNDPYRRAQQEQAAAEDYVAAQQRDAERLATQQAKQAAKEQKAADDAARKAAMTQTEYELRSQGITPWTGADGNLYPDPLHEQKQAEEARKAEQERTNAAAIDTARRSGRRFVESKLTGQPIYLQSEEALAAERAAKAEAARRKKLDDEINAAQAERDFTVADKGYKPLPKKLREEVIPGKIAETEQAARRALENILTEKAKGLVNDNDWVPFNEAPSPEAQTARQRLERLSDPTAPLDEQDLADLAANDATKPHLDNITRDRDILAKDKEAQDYLSAQEKRLADLTLRRDAPEKWAEITRQRRAEMDPETLASELDQSKAEIEQRDTALATRLQTINAKREVTATQIDQLSQQAAQRRQSGLTAGEIVTFTKPDGTVEHWPKDLAEQFERVQAQQADDEAQQADELTGIEAERADLLRLIDLHNESAQLLQTKEQTVQQQVKTSTDRRLRYAPGMAGVADQLDALRQEHADRAAVLEQDGSEFPEEARAALDQDIQTRMDALLATQQQRLAAADAAVSGIQSQLIANPDLNADAGKLYIDAAKNLSEALSISPAEAKTLIDDAEKATQWDMVRGDDVGGPDTNPGWIEAPFKGIVKAAEGTGFVPAKNGGNGVKTRLLSNGGIVVNPTITDKAEYEAAVKASGATPDAQAEAMERYPEIRKRVAQDTLDTIKEVSSVLGEDSLNDWTSWKEWQAKRPADVDPAEWALRWSEDNKSKNTGILGTLLSKTKQFTRNLAAGGNDLRAQFSGLVAGVTGSETAIQDAQWANRKAQAHQSSLELGGHTSGNFISEGFFGMLPRVGSSIVPAAGGAKLFQGGIRLFAGTKLGARWLPSLAAAIAKSETPAQSIKAIDTLTRAGLGGAAAAGAGQTYAAQLVDIYSTLRKEHPELDHKTALRQAQMPAVVSGLATAALTVMGGPKGVERLLTRPDEVRKMMGQAFANQMSRFGFVGKEFLKGGLRETFLEEAPDELISAVAQAVGTGHSVQQAVADFLQTLPSFAVATTALGGMGEGIDALQRSRVDPNTPTNRANLPESIARAEAAIDNLQLPGIDDATREQAQRRAGVVLSLAQGGELIEVEEPDLNAVGWTRDGDTFKPLKGYTGPAVLDIDKGGLPVIKDSYVQNLRDNGLAAVADAIPSTETQTRNRYAAAQKQPAAGPQPASANQPGPQQPQPAAAQGAAPNAGSSANAGAVQNPAQQGTQPARGGSAPAQSGAPVAAEAPSTKAPTTEKAIADWLVDRYMPDKEAESAAKAIAAHPQMAGKSFEDFNKMAGSQRDALFAELGITGSKAKSKAADDPLRFSQSASSQTESSPPPAKAEDLADALAKAQAAYDDTIEGTPERAAAEKRIAYLRERQVVAALAPVKASVKAKEITEADATAAAAKAVEASGQPLTHSTLRQALELGLGWTTERSNVAAHNHLGTKDQSENPMASGDRADTANRPQPTPFSDEGKDPSAARMGPDLSIKSKSPLRKNSAYSRSKLLTLARIKDPAKKAWARQAFAAMEDSLQRHHALYDAIAVGPAAVRRLNGSMTAVEEIDGRITRLLDLDAIVANFDYLSNPAEAIRATGIEEDIHAVVLHLARTQPEKYSPEAIRRQWRKLPQILRSQVWQAYDYGRTTMPAKLTAAQEYHMQNEFLRMLVQDQAFAQAITETVDTPTTLVSWIRDLLRDLSKTLRDLMGLVDAPLRVELESMVAQIADQLRIYEGKSRGNEDRLATLDYLRDPAGIALQAMQSGVLFDHLAQTDPSLSPEAMARAFDLLTPELQSIAYLAYRSSKKPSTKNTERKENKSDLLRHLLTAMTSDRSVSREVQTALLSLSPNPQVSKSAPLLSRLISTLTQRTEAPPADLLALLKQQPEAARKTLASLHARLLRASADLAGAQFAQSQTITPATPARQVAAAVTSTPPPPPQTRPVPRTPLAITEAPRPGASRPAYVNPQAIDAMVADMADRRQRIAEVEEALAKRDAEIEAFAKRNKIDNLVTAKYKLEEQEHRDAERRKVIAENRAKFFLRDNALREIEQARQNGRNIQKESLMFLLGTGQIGRRRGAANLRLMGESEKRMLAALGIGVDTAQDGGYYYTLSRLKSALLAVEYTLDGSAERQLALDDLDYVRQQPVEWQTAPDDSKPAYVQWHRGWEHLIIRDSALADLALTMPNVAAAIPQSESERRATLGLPAQPAPTTERPVSAEKKQDIPSPTPSASPTPTRVEARDETTPVEAPPAARAPAARPSPKARIPLGGKLSLPAEFASQDDLDAFNYQLDRESLLRETTTAAERRKATERIQSLRARLIDESGATKEAIEQKLADYHRAVIDGAKKADPVEVYRPTPFHAFAGAVTDTSEATLPAPVGGDIISGMKAQGIRRLGPPDSSDGWAWYRELKADAAKSKMKPREANRLAKAGDINDAKARLAWIDMHVVSQTGGRSIDEAATELNESEDQQFPITSGEELGRAILDAISARLAARDASPDPTVRAEKEAIQQSSDFRAVAEGARGQAFTGRTLAARVQTGDEIQIGSEWLTVTDIDAEEGTVALDSDRYGPQQIEPDQTVHLRAIGDEVLSPSSSSSTSPSLSDLQNAPNVIAARAEEADALRPYGGPKIERRFGEPPPDIAVKASNATPESVGLESWPKAPTQPAPLPNTDLGLEVDTLPKDPEKGVQNKGSTALQREQAIDEVYGPFAAGVAVMGTQNQDGVTLPHIMRGRGVMLDVRGTPHVGIRSVALPSIGTGHAPGVRFLPLAGDKSNWTGHINKAIQIADPQLDEHTDVYIEPYGGGLVYLQNLAPLLKTTKPVLIASSQEFEPDRNLIYTAIKNGDTAAIEDMRLSLDDMNHIPATPAGKSLCDLLFGGLHNRAPSTASKEAATQFPKLVELLQRPNVSILPWNDVQTFETAVKMARSGRRVTLLEDSNYADLPGEGTEDQYASLANAGPMLPGMDDGQITEFIGKDPAKLLAQKLPVYRAVLDAGGTIVATNNMNHTLLGGLLAEFGDAGHWFGYAHPTRVVPDGWMRHPDGKGVLWSNQRPEYLAILRKGVVNPAEGAPKYGTDTPAGLDFRPGTRRSAEVLDRTAQPRRTPSPHTGGSLEAAESLRQPARPASNGRPARQGDRGNTPPRTPVIDATLAGGPGWDRVTSAQVAAELDAQRRPGDDPLDESPEVETLDYEAQMQEDADRFRPTINEEEDGEALAASSRTLDSVITENPDAQELTNLDLLVHRVGPLNEPTQGRGLFFGDSLQSVQPYARNHEGHDPKLYKVTTKKTFVARNLHDAWQKLFGKRLDLNEIDIRRKLKSVGLAWRWADQQVAKRLRARGFDSFILTAPAPPAKHEIALIGKTAVVTPLPAAVRAAQQYRQPDGSYRIPGALRGIAATGTPNDAGVAGKGPYYTLKEHVAKMYAGKDGRVIRADLTLRKPLIATYSTLTKLQERLYGRMLTGFEPDLSQQFDTWMRRRGYDGAILYDSEDLTQPAEIVTLAASNRRVEYVEPGFYSALAEAIRAKMPARSTPATVVGILKNAGLKQEELKWTGIVPWLQAQAQDGPITQQQVLDYLATEGSVKFTITRLGLNDQQEKDRARYEQLTEEYVRLRAEVGEETFTERMREINRERNAIEDREYHYTDTPRNTQWTLPGGTNPKEVVVTWRQTPNAADLAPGQAAKMSRQELIQWYRTNIFDDIAIDATEQEVSTERLRELYVSNINLREQNKRPSLEAPVNSPNNVGDTTHYGDLDALAWYRTTDRTNATGPGLLVEEFQSKWHQLGRDKGYDQKPTIVTGIQDFAPGDTANYGKQGFRIQLADRTVTNNWYQHRWQAEEAIRHNPDYSGVPDAPYRASWPLMLFKRALLDAVQSGKQWIGWTTGDTQADRYDLSKEVDEIKWHRQTGGVNRTVEIYLKKHSSLFLTVSPDGTILDANGTDARTMEGKPLAEAVGKEIARQILESTADGKLDGPGLKVGGQGMRKFYDDILVKEFGKYAKQLGGGAVESSSIDTEPQEMVDIPRNPTNGPAFVRFEATNNTIHGIEPGGRRILVSTVGGTGRLADMAAQIASQKAQEYNTKLDSKRTPIHLIRITPAMREAVTAGQALFAAPRRARQSMTFDPPFRAPFGDIVRYEWTSKPVGGMETQRISDWENSVTNGQTGREIVHLFKVRKPDGMHTVSLETAMGLLSDTQRRSLTALIRSHHQQQQDERTGQMTLFAAHRQFAPAIRFEGRVTAAPGGMHYDALVEQVRRTKLPSWQREQDDSRRHAIRWIQENPAAIEKDYTEGFMTPQGFKDRSEALTLARQLGYQGGNDAYGLTSADIQPPSYQGEMGLLASSARITYPPFATPEAKALEETRIHAIDAYLHGKRRPIANTPPADQAGGSRAQLQALLDHIRRAQRPSGPLEGDEKARITEARRRDKTLLTDWARNAGILLTEYPDRYPLNGANDKGGSEHHAFEGERWVKITKGDGSSFGYQPLDEGKDDEWMISKEPADLLSYLQKLALHNQVFHDDIVLHGVVADPLGKVALIISQPHYKGTFAGVYTAIKPAMEAAGFVRVEPPSARKEEPSAYYRASDNVAVIDLHSENAVLQDNGTFLRVFDNIIVRPTGALRATFERLAAKRQPIPAAQRVEQAAAQVDPNPTPAQQDAGLKHWLTHGNHTHPAKPSDIPKFSSLNAQGKAQFAHDSINLGKESVGGDVWTLRTDSTSGRQIEVSGLRGPDQGTMERMGSTESGQSSSQQEQVVRGKNGAEMDQEEPETPQSKAESLAAKQRDEEYLAAVRAGDLTKAQQMVKAAASAAGYTIEALHGTPFGDIRVFDSGSNPDWYEGIAEDDDKGNYSEGVHWFTDSLFNAQTYASGYLAQNAGPYDEANDSLRVNVPQGPLPKGVVMKWFPGGKGWWKKGLNPITLTEEQIQNDTLPPEALTPSGRMKRGSQLQVYFPNHSSLGGAFFENSNGGKQPSSPQRVLEIARQAYNTPLWLRTTSRVIPVYLKLQNPKIIDMGGERFRRMGRKADRAFREGHDGMIIRNVIDPGAAPLRAEPQTTFAVFSPYQIKSSLPVTYNDDGTIIPLSERFDTSKKDILFASPRPLATLSSTISRAAQATSTAAASIARHTGLEAPLATLGSNNLDKRLSAALDRVAGPKVNSAKAAALAWLNQTEGAAPTVKGFIDQLLPNALMPREWLALKHEMDRKSAFGAEQANDLIRALSDKARLSDLAYPPEFSQDPKWRTQMFDAMEGKVPMSSLPEPLQRLAERLRTMLRQTGEELVRQGLMNPDTFEELQAHGWMPRYTEDEALAAGGSFLKAFKLGVRDLLQQRSTAYHVVDTSRRDRTGQYVTVNREEGGKRNRWRFRDKAHRDAWFQTFLRQHILTQLRDESPEVKAMLTPLGRTERTALRDQIKNLSIESFGSIESLSPALRRIIKDLSYQAQQRFQAVDPFTPEKLVKDPVYAVARYILGQSHNAATMELMRSTAANPEWTTDVDTAGFTLIPDSPRFGPLAGKYLREDIARQILDLVDVPNAALRAYDGLLRKWKAAKLVWNPGSHIRDAIGNTVFAYLGGNSIWNPGNWQHYRDAIQILREGQTQPGTNNEEPTTFSELLEQQVLGGDAYSTQVKERLKGLLPDTKTIEDFNPGLLQRTLMGFGSAFHGTNEWLSDIRRVPDDFYKIAAYLRYKEQFRNKEPGTKNQELQSRAAAEVRKWFPYYDRLGSSGTTKAIGRFINPFFSFFRESTRILLTAAHERPLALTAALAFPSAITALSAMMLGLDDRDREEVEKDLAGRGLGILGLGDTRLFSMLLPFRSSSGQVQQWDISSTMPFADLLGSRIVPLEEKESAFQTAWRKLLSAGPVMGLAYSWATNRDTFSGRHIVEADMTPGEQLAAYTGHAAGVMLPPLAPDLIGAGPLSKAGDVQTNKTLQTYDPVQTWLRSFLGINVKSAEPSLYRLADDFRAKEGLQSTQGYDYGTTRESRAKRALVAALAQPEPDLARVKVLAEKLRELGISLATPKDIEKVLKIIDPAQVIGGGHRKDGTGITAADARQRFRASLPPEARQNYEQTLQLYQRILSRAPVIITRARTQ